MKDRTSILSELSIENDVKWEPDGKICKLCQQKFGYLQNRRHHCRTCGILICENCSFFKDVMLLNNTSTKKIRLCTECIDKYDLAEEEEPTVNATTTSSDVVTDNNTIELLPTMLSPPNSPYKNPNENSTYSLVSIASYISETLTPVKDMSLDEIQTIPLTDEKQHQQIIVTTKSLSILDTTDKEEQQEEEKEEQQEENQCELINCDLFQFWK